MFDLAVLIHKPMVVLVLNNCWLCLVPYGKAIVLCNGAGQGSRVIVKWVISSTTTAFCVQAECAAKFIACNDVQRAFY